MIVTASDFGHLIKLNRKKSKITQVDLAAAAGVGERFIRELERGKPSCQLDKALRIALMLGIRFEVVRSSQKSK